MANFGHMVSGSGSMCQRLSLQKLQEFDDDGDFGCRWRWWWCWCLKDVSLSGRILLAYRLVFLVVPFSDTVNLLAPRHSQSGDWRLGTYQQAANVFHFPSFRLEYGPVPGVSGRNVWAARALHSGMLKSSQCQELTTYTKGKTCRPTWDVGGTKES